MSYHDPVLLRPSVDALVREPDGVYVDVTFGGGGHSREIIKRLGVDGRLIAFDRDEEAVRNALDDTRFTLIQSDFKYLKRYLRFLGIEAVDGILADLGVSSHQFDKAERGFTFRQEAPLDMRMNPTAGQPASAVLNDYREDQLVEVFSRYGEVRNSKTLASAIVQKRKERPYRTTTDLRATIDSLPHTGSKRYLAQVFQALRIEVNDEMGALRALLAQSLESLDRGGRLVIISYHSVEDRLVKGFLKTGGFKGEVKKDEFGRIYRPFKLITKKPVVSPDEEILENPRSRSAKMRVAEKI